MYEQKSIEEVERLLSTSIKYGLSEKESEYRLKNEGKNILNKKKKKGILSLFFSQFYDPMVFVLIVGCVLSFILKEITDGFIILFVIILNAILGTVQEYRAEKALNALKDMSSPHAIVKRDGIYKEIKTEEIVPGDILKINEGNIIAADVRLIETFSMKIDESSLTGESEPVEKNANMIISSDTPLGDKKNLAFMSTALQVGHGEGIVISTGMNTEIGKIAKLIDDAKEEMTPLQKKLGGLGKLLGALAVFICAFLFFITLIQKRNSMEMFITSLSLAVAAIPEGLPAVVTIVLAIGVQKMAKANAIVRRLPSVETLGAVSVILSDKTGTLTENKMKAVEVFYNGEIYEEEAIENISAPLLFDGFTLCNNASIEDGSFGDPTEVALLQLAKRKSIHKKELDRVYKRINEIPFDSKRKMMTTTHIYQGKTIHFTKGALDWLVRKCKYIYINEKIIPIEERHKQHILKVARDMGKKALRVLAIGFSEVVPEEEMVFVGCVGMIDPPRKEAKSSISTLKQAGIKTVMITGDHVDTAFAIAKSLGIAESESQCVSSDIIEQADDDALKEIIKDVTVFARVTPTHKVRLVQAFKNNGNIVAMTGDGVNDAPSLKNADIGIAMGITGTDVAKNAADIVLSDDNFSSIEKAVEEGRGIYDNIRKTIIFALSSNMAEVMSMLIAVIIGYPMPLIAIHILWVNLITDSIPAIALGADKKDNNVMKEKPRLVNESIFARGGYKLTFLYGGIITIITIIAFLIVPLSTLHLEDPNFSLVMIKDNFYKILDLFNTRPDILTKSRTYAFTTLCISQLFHMIGMSSIKENTFSILKKKNFLMYGALLIGIILQVLVTEVPILTTFFDTTSLSFKEWLWLLLMSSYPLLVHEFLVSYFKRRHF